MEKVLIINFNQDRNFQNRYNRIGNEPILPFATFKYGPTLEKRIFNLGAKESFDYYKMKWHHITGLFPIKGVSNVYYGDLFGLETLGIWIDPTKETITIAIFIGHCPKLKNGTTLRKAREKKVLNYIIQNKNKNKG